MLESVRVQLLGLMWPLLPLAFGAIDVSTAKCQQACTALTTSLPAGSVSPITLTGYWAQQAAAVTPACYVQPSSTEQVATIIKTARKYSCPFAIKGAGHSDVPGASNSPGGITMDLALFSGIVPAADKSYTTIGAGQNWGNVYDVLDLQNITVIGGRESSVGVAGLTLGGGISYFSGLRGLACDNVENYEVVLANGDVVQANRSSSYKDLYKALRGGGNNFGVVTRFSLSSYSQGLMYGGFHLYSDSTQVTNAIISAFSTFAHNAPSDPNAFVFISLLYSGGSYMWSAYPTYALPNDSPAIFAPFRVPALTAAQTITTARIARHGNFATELGVTQPSGERNRFFTATFTEDSALIHSITEVFRSEVAAITADGVLHNSTGFGPNLSFQPFSKNVLAHGAQRGGNVLGLGAGEAPLMVMSMAWPWIDPRDDAAVLGGMQRVTDGAMAAAKQRGMLNEFIYMNYAPPGLEVIESYGADNVDFMKGVSEKYDPEGVFQKLVPGGFKL